MFRFRCPIALFVCVVLCTAAGYAQPAASFTTKTSSAGTMPRDVYAVDVNGDGIPDLIEDSPGVPNTVSVMIGNGTGTFQAPKTVYTFPTTYQGTAPMVTGDFNGDGKVDLVFALAGSNQLAVFLGNGNGTFQAPKFETIALPNGEYFGGGGIVAADFNHDGKVDLVTEGNTSTAETLYVLPGDGTGSFGAPQTIYTFAANTGMGSLGIGDFDGDGNADLAVGVNSSCTQGGCSQEDVYVLYGNGAFGFTSDHAYSGGPFSFSTGDVNSDGRTDIFGIGGSNELVVLTSQAGRAFTTFTMTTSLTLSGSPGTAAPMVLADFNGDGHMDLATVGFNSTTSVFAVFLANGSGGYEEQSVDIGAAQYLSNAVVEEFGQDAKPDLAAVWSSTTTSATVTAAVNNTPSGNWGACVYPDLYPSVGVTYCSPNEASANSVRISAVATTLGPMRKMEAWVDGKKIAEQYHVWENRGWLDLTTTMSPGTHQVTVIAADVDDSLQNGGHFPITVVSCEAPGSPGVTICSPVNGSTVGENVNIVAAANVTGTLAHLELWIDGAMKFSGPNTSPLVDTLTLAAGTHRIAVLAVNTAGEKWESVANVTVSSDLGCSAPSSPGVHLCSPTGGASETETGVIEVLATATVTGKLANMQLWVDGAKETSESTSNTMHIASYPVGTGSHRIAVLAVNTAGQVWEQAVTVTSQ